MRSRLLQLAECGQSYWLDDLTRGMMRSGELDRRVKEEGLRGVTANPTTFAQALKSDDYDDDILRLAREGLGTDEIYERLLVSDVRQACDLFLETHRATNRLDGYVSLEVSPLLAHDAAGTMREARKYRDLVDRPNLFIKVPGTAAGFSAIEQLLYEGLSINITLLFSLPAYDAVSEAYLRAMERRVAEGRSLDAVASVASFFLSRIDRLVDQLLSQRDRPGDAPPLSSRLRGQAAVACAKLAYRSFRRAFSGERWDRLAVKGARVQRPLWASTGTKDPRYRDVYYVEPLIGRDTVNTMPAKTITAFADHGEVRPNQIEQGIEEAARVIQDLSEAGIDLHCVAWQLEHEGVRQFTESFNSAHEALEAKRRRAATKPAAA
ncbi:MAG TPA: transaldolase [Nitrospira sp.]|nr:transaldolase [Nitrospira sp.]